MGHGIKALGYLAVLVLTVGGNSTYASTPTATEVAKLVAGEAAGGYYYNTLFGAAVAIDGDTAVVAAPDEPPAGAAYVFVRVGGVWSLQQKLIPGDGGNYQTFGSAVAIDGDTAVIGASNYGTNRMGAAYVFRRNSGAWTQQQRLVANDGRTDYAFGNSVAVVGDTVLVGDPRRGMYDSFSGAVYVFTRSAGEWIQQQLLEASDLQTRQAFGTSLAFDGDMALIGAPGDADNGVAAGAAYVFQRVGGAWIEQQKLLASDGGASGGFGNSVALQGSTAIAGAYWGDANGAGPGSAYVFNESGGSWTQQQKLTASDGVYGDSFGLSVAIDGNKAVISAYADDDNGTDSGSAYVFSRSGTTWTESIKLLASDGATYDHFGGGRRGVAISGATVLVGAYYHDSIGSDDGAVYAYELILDTTAPAIQPTISGTLGINGWYVSDVGVSWVVTDPESAITTSIGCGPSIVNTDTGNQILTCAASSAGGAATEFVTIKRDATPPVATAGAMPAANIYGWRNKAVTVTFSGTDGLSGVASCNSPVTLSSEGAGQSASGRCFDAAGNQSNLATVTGINIDKTPPAITITTPTNGATYRRKQKVTASYTCADDRSGIAACTGTVANGQPIDTTSKVGNVTFTVTAADKAGNTASQSVTYRVK